MGVWGGACSFDEQRFREIVVPALRAGPGHPLVARTLERLWADGRALEEYPDSLITPPDFLGSPCRFDGLEMVMAHVDEAFTTSDLGRDFWIVDGVLAEPDRPGWGYWDLVELVEWMITREALPAWGLLGLRGGWPWEVFDRVPWPERRIEPGSESSRLEQLFARLDTRTGYWVHGGGGYAEGICGWLNTTQTHELATLLPRSSAESKKKWEQDRFWTVLEWSVERGLGLLWGRDLHLFYADDPTASILDQGAAPIIRLA